MAHARAPAVAAPAANPIGTAIFWIAMGLSCLYMLLGVALLVTPNKIIGPGWTAWCKDWWAVIGAIYISLQMAPDFAGAIDRTHRIVINWATTLLPLVPVVAALAMTSVKWGYWEKNIAISILGFVVADALNAFRAGR